MSQLKEAPLLPAPATGWFGRHATDQGGGIIALVAPPDGTHPVEGGPGLHGPGAGHGLRNFAGPQLTAPGLD